MCTRKKRKMKTIGWGAEREEDRTKEGAKPVGR